MTDRIGAACGRIGWRYANPYSEVEAKLTSTHGDVWKNHICAVAGKVLIRTSCSTVDDAPAITQTIVGGLDEMAHHFTCLMFWVTNPDKYAAVAQERNPIGVVEEG